MVRRLDPGDYRAMKHVIASTLLCLPAHLSAAERCAVSRTDRDEIVRMVSAKPLAPRIDSRPIKVRPPAAWQRLLLFEQQIL